MDGLIVITFRVAGGAGRGFLDRARALRGRLEAVGGVLVAFDATKVSFALEDPTLERTIDVLVKPGPDTGADETAWAVGIAQGTLEPFGGETSAGASSLAWGPPLVAASLLAGKARPGEILCAETVRALRAGAIVTMGARSAREGDLRIRGARIDRTAPWRKQRVERLSRMRVAPLVGGTAPTLRPTAGGVTVLRADPGMGGTRMLTELAASMPRALLVSPAGSGFEPLGALRRALARSLSRELSPLLMELSDHLETLLSGEGVALDVAARLVSAFLWPKTSAGSAGALLIDDAKAIDPSSLEACVRAAKSSASFGLVVRLDATGSPPSSIAAMPRAAELELTPLTRGAAEELAASCSNDALDPVAKKRWARLGGGAPLGVVEAVAWGLSSGELSWPNGAGEGEGKARPRTRTSGRGRVRPAEAYLKLRAGDESDAGRSLLCLVALLGGEAKIGRLARILAVAGQRIDVETTVAELVTTRWLVDTQEDWLSLPSRTHQSALAGILDPQAKQALHRAAADVIDDEEGTFGRVDGAWHAAQAGDAKRAARTLLAAASATADAELEASTTQLIAYARRTDPECEEQALELLSNALSRVHSLAPSVPAEQRVRPSSAPPPVRIIPPPPAARPPTVPPPPPPERRTSDSMRAAAPLPPPLPRPLPDAPITEEDFAQDEPDSMIERALIVGPNDTARNVVQNAHHDSEPPTLMKESLPPPGAPSGSSPVSAGRFPPIRSARPAAVDDDAETPVEAGEVQNGRSPSEPPQLSPSGSNIAVRLGELAKEALIAGDNASLERWVDGLRASGENPIFTERMRAMARIVRGDIGDALRVLRRMRQGLDPKDHAVRCQTSLAMGIALSVAGRPQEALLEGMDALARARQTGDDRAAEACVAFLAKLFSSVGRTEEAQKLVPVVTPPA